MAIFKSPVLQGPWSIGRNILTHILTLVTQTQTFNPCINLISTSVYIYTHNIYTYIYICIDNIYIYMVGGFKHFLFSIIYGTILPIDFHMFQDG